MKLAHCSRLIHAGMAETWLREIQCSGTYENEHRRCEMPAGHSGDTVRDRGTIYDIVDEMSRTPPDDLLQYARGELDRLARRMVCQGHNKQPYIGQVEVKWRRAIQGHIQDPDGRGCLR